MSIKREQQQRLKDVLGRPVPKIYLDLMRSLRPKLLAQLTEFGADEEQPLFRDVETVIRENQLAREEDIWTEEGPWPDDQLMIGAEIGGDKFSLRVSDRPPAVYRLNHEIAEFERIGTLRTFLSAVKRWAAGDAGTITEVLSGRSKKKRKQKEEPAWVVAKRKNAAKASQQEQRALRTNEATHWGDATLFYRDGDRIADALRCCERWIALRPGSHFELGIRHELLDAWFEAETGTKKNRALKGKYREVFDSLQALADARVEAARAYSEACQSVDPRPYGSDWCLRVAEQEADEIRSKDKR